MCTHTNTYTHAHTHTIHAHKNLLSRSIAISIQRYWKNLIVDTHYVLHMAVLISIPPLSVLVQVYIKPVTLLCAMILKVAALLDTHHKRSKIYSFTLTMAPSIAYLI